MTEPLTEATFYILLSLSPQPKHGYAIMKDVRQMSKGRVVLSTGTLYGALKRLLEQDWILRSDVGQNGHSGRLRKAYSLSRTGQRILEAEVTRLDYLLATARAYSADQALES